MSILEMILLAYARYFPVRRGKFRIVNALWRHVVGGGSRYRMAKLRYADFRMPCNLDEMLQRQFYFFGTYFLEEEILRAWMREARKSQVVFDIGANAGIFSLAALAANPDVAVHAFEPTPEIAARLHSVCSINQISNLAINEVAVGDRNGAATLRRWRGADNSNEGQNFITQADDPASAEKVSLLTLDQYCAERGIDFIDLLKIDIQGNEPFAFAGAARLLREKRIRTIFAELTWNPGAENEPAARLVAILEEAGFSFAAPGRTLAWRKPGDWMRAHSDIVARITA